MQENNDKNQNVADESGENVTAVPTEIDEKSYDEEKSDGDNKKYEAEQKCAKDEIVRADKRLKTNNGLLAIFFIAILVCAWLFLPFYRAVREDVEIYQTVIKNDEGIQIQIKEVKERNAQLNDINNKKNSYQKDFDKLLPNVRELESTRKSVTKELSGLRSESEEYARILKEQTPVIKKLQKGKNDLSLSVSSLTLERQKLTSSVDLLDKRRKNLDVEVGGLEQKKSEAEQLILSIKRLTEQLAGLRKEKTEINNLILQRDNLKNKIATNTSEIKILDERINDLNSEATGLKEIISKGETYENNIKDLSSRKTKLNEDIRALSREIENLQSDKKVLEKIKAQDNLKSLQMQVEDLESKRKAFQESIRILEETKEALESTISESTGTKKSSK